MKLIYKGKYTGDPATLPHGDHISNSVKFREFDDIRKFSIVMNAVAIVVTILFLTLMNVRTEIKTFELISIGAVGAFAIGMGLGDYYNIYNTIVQMPNCARVYMYGFNSYWYIPNK